MSKSSDDAAKRPNGLLYVQKWVLQRKNPQGLFVRVGTYNRPISQGEVAKEFGDGYYVLRSCKPRFKTSWKGQLGEAKDTGGSTNLLSREIRGLRQKVNYLTLGEGLLAVGEVVGFGLTARSFGAHNTRLNRTEAALEAYYRLSPLPFFCGTCRQPFYDFLDTYCGHCGTKIDWPDKRPTDQTAQQHCTGCGSATRSGQLFCTGCGRSLASFVQTPKWIVP